MDAIEIVGAKPMQLGSVRYIWEWTRGAPWGPLLIIFVVLFCAAFGDIISPQDATRYDLINTFTPPFWETGGSSAYLLGTDNMGRDILSRIIGGARISVIVAFFGILLSGATGTGVGLISGYFGKRIDQVLMRLVDIQLSIPGMLLALILVATFGASLKNVIIVIAITGWAGFARIVRGEVLSIKSRDFIALAKVMGASRWRILLYHIFPQIMNTLMILATLQVGSVMIFEASLSFLGLGVQPPTPSWGLMLAEGRQYLTSAWWLATFPGLAILLTCLSTNLLGDWLRDKLDPRLRQM